MKLVGILGLILLSACVSPDHYRIAYQVAGHSSEFYVNRVLSEIKKEKFTGDICIISVEPSFVYELLENTLEHEDITIKGKFSVTESFILDGNLLLTVQKNKKEKMSFGYENKIGGILKKFDGTLLYFSSNGVEELQVYIHEFMNASHCEDFVRS